jgi:hypothetical protein
MCTGKELRSLSIAISSNVVALIYVVRLDHVLSLLGKIKRNCSGAEVFGFTGTTKLFNPSFSPHSINSLVQKNSYFQPISTIFSRLRRTC